MNWEAIGAIGEVVDAAGVISSLVYLAVQIRQNTKSVRRASARQSSEKNAVALRGLEARPKSLHRGSTIAIRLGRPGMGGGHARSSRVTR